uniref:(California timema) hypothetical protein n=1 Tax=Timema californicum TaxID=61474 RepID=A0A7R9IY34_TIMCA|nr:unnamed protein product [Timema californicum]
MNERYEFFNACCGLNESVADWATRAQHLASTKSIRVPFLLLSSFALPSLSLVRPLAKSNEKLGYPHTLGNRETPPLTWVVPLPRCLFSLHLYGSRVVTQDLNSPRGPEVESRRATELIAEILGVVPNKKNTSRFSSRSPIGHRVSNKITQGLLSMILLTGGADDSGWLAMFWWLVPLSDRGQGYENRNVNRTNICYRLALTNYLISNEGELPWKHRPKGFPSVPTCVHGQNSTFKFKELSMQDVRKIHQHYYKQANLQF